MAEKLEDLGWANGWPETKMPPIVEKCQNERFSGLEHDYREGPGPWACTHVVECLTCGYTYIYDSGD